MGNVVEGVSEGDTVYLNDVAFTVSSIRVSPPTYVGVTLFGPSEDVSISGDWSSLRSDLGVELEGGHG